MFSAILNTIGPFIFWMLKKWVEANEQKKEMIESYYTFLEAVDQSGQVKVANHLAAAKALKSEQERLAKELQDEQTNQ